MPTCPSWSGSNRSLDPVSVLWSLSVTPLFDQSDRLRRDAMAAAQRAQAFRRGRLDAHDVSLQPQPPGDVPLHLDQHEVQPWLLGDHRGVDVDDLVAGLLQQARRKLEQIHSGHTLPLWVRFREVLADVTERGRAEQRVDDGVREYVRIGMSFEAERMLDMDAAK